MDFYAFLPSTASSNEMPNNRQSDFTTLYRPAIKLTQPYEVALTEISHSTKYRAELGSLKISNPFVYNHNFNLGRIEHFVFNLSVMNGQSTSSFIKNLNEAIEARIIMSEYNYRKRLSENLIFFIDKFYDFYDSENWNVESEENKPIIYVLRQNKVLRILDKNEGIFSKQFKDMNILYDKKTACYLLTDADIQKNTFFNFIFLDMPDNDYSIEDFYSHSVSEPHDSCHISILNEFKLMHNIPKFDYKENILTISYMSPHFYSLSGLITVLLTNLTNTLELYSTKTFQMQSSLNIINHAMILTDIINDQYFGDIRSPVLYTINLSSNDSYVTTSFENPHYLPVSVTDINSINIKILDLSGRHIKFTDIFSVVILKLHFRPRKNVSN